MKAFRYHKPASIDGASTAGAKKGAILKAEYRNACSG